MTASINYEDEGADLDEAVRLGEIAGLAQSGEDGLADSSDITIDDAAGSRNLIGLKRVSMRETTATPELVWTGYAADRTIGRGERFKTGVQRQWTTTLVDLNSALTRFLIHGNTAAHGNRPAETVGERLTWLLGSSFGSWITDDGEVVYPDSPMDATDYRGRYPADVLGDCAEASPGGYLWSLYFNDSEVTCLYFHNQTYTGYQSTLQISNVLSDIDHTITFEPDPGAVLVRDPSEVWSGVQVNYGNSGAHVFVDRPATRAAFGRRETVIDRPNVTTAASATARANHFLDNSDGETDTITCTIWLPAALVTSIRVLNRVKVKFSHLPGYQSWTWLRVIHIAPAQDEPTGEFWHVHLTLSNPKSIGTGGGGGQGPGDNTQPPVTPPFVPECTDTSTFIQGAIGTNSGGDEVEFASPVSEGHSVTIARMADPGAATTTDNGWTPITPVITIPFSIHLGGPAHFRAWNKVITALDLTDPTTHIYTPTKVFSIPTFTIASGFQLGAWEHTADITTVAFNVATGASGVADPGGAPAGSLGFGFASGVGFPDLSAVVVGGYTTAGNIPDAFSNTPWAGYVQGAPAGFTVGLGVSTEWVAVSIGYTGEISCTQPVNGQMVDGELFGTTDGLTSQYQTNYPYTPSSLHLKVGGTDVTPIEDNPTTGLFSIPAVWAATTGFAITGWYLATTDGNPTGADNPTPDPEAGLVQPGEIVVAETTFGLAPDVGSSLAYARDDHTHGSPPTSALLAWDLLTTGEPDPELIFSGGSVTWVEVTP